MRDSTFASCATDDTCNVTNIVAVWSGLTWMLAATMLTLFSATTLVISFSRPVRSYASIRTEIGYVWVGWPSHSTWINRPTSFSLTTGGHVGRRTVTPRPRVT